MSPISLKPSHKIIKDFYAELTRLQASGYEHEGAVAPQFAGLLRHCANSVPNLTFVEQFPIKGDTLRADGAVVDRQTNVLLYGIWEAKSARISLEKEIQKKFSAGYPRENTLFQTPNRLVLYRHGHIAFDADIRDNPDQLIHGLEEFFSYKPPAYEQWEQAIEAFRDKVGELGKSLAAIIGQSLKTNAAFSKAFSGFRTLCREAINPNLSEPAIVEMLVQHLLTERLFRRVFSNADFVDRNIIAREIETVVVSLTSQSFSREEFLKSLDRFYAAIETTAATIEDYSLKQHFLNVVYERFFQGFAVKIADTHGIVYTPQPIVGFMVKSVQEILQREFGMSLADKGVHVIDPFVGTGNFILRIMREIYELNPFQLEYKYDAELHCNEVMLLPYYIASMNIEHEFYEMTGKYKPFEGICLADTFELAEDRQRELFAPENTQRVNRQKEAPIFVVIGNPPYNAGQINENDNNKNRKYRVMDKRVSETYARDSKATNKNALSDPYVKAFAWATDRLKNREKGIVAFVTNNGFLDGIAFDGMRKHLAQEFEKIYIVDAGGNVRKNPKLSGTTHNVFGIQVGVSVIFLIKNRRGKPNRQPDHIKP